MNEKKIAESIYYKMLIASKPRLKNRPTGIKYAKRKNNR